MDSRFSSSVALFDLDCEPAPPVCGGTPLGLPVEAGGGFETSPFPVGGGDFETSLLPVGGGGFVTSPLPVGGGGFETSPFPLGGGGFVTSPFPVGGRGDDPSLPFPVGGGGLEAPTLGGPFWPETYQKEVKILKTTLVQSILPLKQSTKL